jgi:hypothetical protein
VSLAVERLGSLPDVIPSTQYGRLEGYAMAAKVPAPQTRRPHGELKTAIREYLGSKEGRPASISEIKAVLEPKIGHAPDSSYRSSLQDERYFERVSRGVYKLRPVHR